MSRTSRTSSRAPRPLGSTTGNLWATGDGGDSWTAVALNLPPISAVRFG